MQYVRRGRPDNGGAAERLKAYTWQKEYGKRFDVNNRIIRDYYIRFRKSKGCGLYAETTNGEKIEFDCNIEDMFYKTFAGKRQKKTK
ncbi:MAG: hypothetical protein LBU77_05465 [Clostridiales bacterium]|nr:hypothetical protein [Clostridiales bacterium]